MIRIEACKKGDTLRLLSFGCTDLIYRQRLLSLGITRGVVVTVVRFAPLGCPVQIEVRNTAVSLRKEEARHLEWERL